LKKKNRMLTMRISETDLSLIKAKASNANLNMTEYITQAALDKSIVTINGIDDVLKEQKAIGRNLNQITTLCNMGKIRAPDFEEIKTGFSSVTDKLSELLQRCR